VEAVGTPVLIAYDVEFRCGVDDSSVGQEMVACALQNWQADRTWQVFIQCLWAHRKKRELYNDVVFGWCETTLEEEGG